MSMPMSVSSISSNSNSNSNSNGTCPFPYTVSSNCVVTIAHEHTLLFHAFTVGFVILMGVMIVHISAHLIALHSEYKFHIFQPAKRKTVVSITLWLLLVTVALMLVSFDFAGASGYWNLHFLAVVSAIIDASIFALHVASFEMWIEVAKRAALPNLAHHGRLKRCVRACTTKRIRWVGRLWCMLFFVSIATCHLLAVSNSRSLPSSSQMYINMHIIMLVCYTLLLAIGWVCAVQVHSVMNYAQSQIQLIQSSNCVDDSVSSAHPFVDGVDRKSMESAGRGGTGGGDEEEEEDEQHTVEENHRLQVPSFPVPVAVAHTLAPAVVAGGNGGGSGGAIASIHQVPLTPKTPRTPRTPRTRRAAMTLSSMTGMVRVMTLLTCLNVFWLTFCVYDIVDLYQSPFAWSITAHPSVWKLVFRGSVFFITRYVVCVVWISQTKKTVLGTRGVRLRLRRAAAELWKRLKRTSKTVSVAPIPQPMNAFVSPARPPLPNKEGTADQPLPTQRRENKNQVYEVSIGDMNGTDKDAGKWFQLSLPSQIDSE